jgi:NADH dehydrogenase
VPVGQVTTRVAVTGANSAVGRAIVRCTARDEWSSVELVATVRSERAAGEVPPVPEGRGRVARARYDDAEALQAAFAGAQSLIHLPGVLVERPGSSYEAANVETTEAAVAAALAAGVRKLVLVSAHGADAGSANRYFATKGQAEERVQSSGLAWTILRAPLLLGPDTQEARSLQHALARSRCWQIAGGRTLQEPLDVDDLAVAALRTATQLDLADGALLDLGGPERVTTRELFERAARLAGTPLRIRSAPAGPLRLGLALRSRLLGPGPSPDFLEVLLTDTRADAARAAEVLGIKLTPLDATIRKSLKVS